MIPLWLFPIVYQINQIINVNNTTPCFLNYTAGAQMWQNCGIGKDFIQGSLVMWEWVTGGYFSMIIVSILILGVYIKYQKVVYPMVIGIMFLPVSYFLFPSTFIIWGAILMVTAVGLLIAYIMMSQTNEQ